MFMCLSGECISMEKVCDKAKDCIDLSDESERCGELSLYLEFPKNNCIRKYRMSQFSKL